MSQLDVTALLADVSGERVDAHGHDKIASGESSEPMEKLASELDAAGAVMADAFVDRTLERLEKTAMDRASSSHASAGGVTEPSSWSKVKEKIQAMKGGGGGDPDSGHIRAEQAYKNRIGKGLGTGRES